MREQRFSQSLEQPSAGEDPEGVYVNHVGTPARISRERQRVRASTSDAATQGHPCCLSRLVILAGHSALAEHAGQASAREARIATYMATTTSSMAKKTVRVPGLTRSPILLPAKEPATAATVNGAMTSQTKLP